VRADGPLFLVGFMGAGKTVVGEALARRLGRAFEDTDALVVASAGVPIETIFRERGEGRFREMEWDVLRGVVLRQGTVVATGGGTFLGTAQRALMRGSGTSIWLDVPFGVIASRLGDDALRPLWAAADAIERRAMFERRRAAYALADATVDAGRGTVEDVALRTETVWRSLYR
jgi:shikimate kinase